jgi:transcriptional regulator with XRE-family HTH domain
MMHENNAVPQPPKLPKRPTPGERLRYERLRHNLTQDRLAEMVGTTTISVSRWESDVHLPDIKYRRRLCKIFGKKPQDLGFVNDIDTGRDEAGGDKNKEKPVLLSKETGRVAASALSGAHTPASIVDGQRLQNWYAQVTADHYFALPQRELELQRLQAELQNPHGAPVVVIDGLGGLGKTAIAVELARRLLTQQSFEDVVGDSAKLQMLSGEEIIQVRTASLDFDLLLNAIAQQLRHWDLLTLQPDKKRTAMAQLLRQQRHLILVDNLETVENSQVLVAQLHAVLYGSRAIVTSRDKVHHSFVYSHTIHELDRENALVFMRMEQQRHTPLLHAELDDADAIYEVTGGAPLAMKLVLAQSLSLDLAIVLRRLWHAGSNLYPYIFRQSWEQLSPTAQHLLVYIGKTAMQTVRWEELLDAEIAAGEEELLEALDQLVCASLLDVSATSSRRQHSYSMHQLTRQFVCSELPDSW